MMLSADHIEGLLF